MFRNDSFDAWLRRANWLLVLSWTLVFSEDIFGQTVGTKLWEFAPGNTPFAPVSDNVGNLYFGSGTGSFLALTKDGIKKWEFKDLFQPDEIATVVVGNPGNANDTQSPDPALHHGAVDY